MAVFEPRGRGKYVAFSDKQLDKMRKEAERKFNYQVYQEIREELERRRY